MSDSRQTQPLWKRPVFVWSVIWIAIVAVAIAGTRFYSPGQEPELVGNGGNEDIIDDPVAFAQEQFDSSVVPTIEENAIDLPTLLGELQSDSEATGTKYGHKNGDSPYSFPVTATGTITEGGFGEVDLTVDGIDGVTVGIQTGPAIKGTAIRDATGDITFGMFENQTDFAQAATELNNQVKATVLSEHSLGDMIGQHVTVVGAFTYDDPSHIVITPVSIEVN